MSGLRKRVTQKLFWILFAGLIFTTCERVEISPADYETRNVIIIVMDGARYSETWGDPTHQFIPRMAHEMADQGIIYTHFRNNGHMISLFRKKGTNLLVLVSRNGRYSNPLFL